MEDVYLPLQVLWSIEETTYIMIPQQDTLHHSMHYMLGVEASTHYYTSTPLDTCSEGMSTHHSSPPATDVLRSPYA